MQNSFEEIAEQATTNGALDPDKFATLLIRDVLTQIRVIAHNERFSYMGDDPPASDYLWGISKHYGVKDA